MALTVKHMLGVCKAVCKYLQRSDLCRLNYAAAAYMDMVFMVLWIW